MSMKINLAYQYFALLIGISCLITGWFSDKGLMLAVGCIVAVGATGTIIHLRTRKHNPSSKLPKDIKTDG